MPVISSGGERLTVARLAAVVLSAAELEDDDLLLAVLRGDLRLDLRPCEQRRPIFTAVPSPALADEENLAERDGVADVARELLDVQLVALGDPVLLAACLDYRVGSCH